MPARDTVTDLVALVHVADVQRSADWYAKLGFAIADTQHEDGRLVWCFLKSTHARLMLVAADAPVESGRQGVLFYAYARDLEGLRENLLAAGIDPGEIHDGPSGLRQIGMYDPDGYCVMVAQIRGERVGIVPDPAP